MSAARDDLEHLLAHAGWVRGLCHELVGAGDADDLAQDAWVVALEQHARAGRPSAWLSGVVRKLAGRRWRAAERRGRRERAVARPEAQPGADELVAEAELQRSLIRAVTELDEPYRSTALLRFYRGLEPAEIARLQAVPAATVRTRLARGLERLRGRLDRDHGGRSAWAAVLAPAALDPAVLTGGTLLGTKLAVGGAGALALVAGYAVITGRDGDDGGGTRGAETAAAVPEAAGPARARQAPPDPAPGATREAVTEAVASAPAAAEVLLFGAAADPEGRPIQLEGVSVRDASYAYRSTSRLAPGSWSIAGLAPGRYELEARAAGFLTLRETLELDAREHERRDLVLAPALVVPVRIVDETGAVVPQSEHALQRVLEVAVTRDPPGDGLGGLDRHANRLGLGDIGEPDGPLPGGCQSVLRLRVPPPVHVSLIACDATLDTVHVEGPVDVLELRLDRARLAERLGGVRVRFVDVATGALVEGGRAALDPPRTHGAGELPLEDGAVFELAGRAPGIHRLRFFHPEYAEAAPSVRVAEGRIEDLGEVSVWPKATIRATVLDAGGAPLGATVYTYPLDALRGPADLAASVGQHAPGGRFELQRAPRGPVRLLVTAAGHARLARTLDASGGLLDGVVLRLSEGVQVVLEPRLGSVGSQVTIAEEQGGPLETWTLGSRPIVTRLEAGRYQLWTGVAERVDAVEDLVVGAEPLVVPVGQVR